jgi:thymidine phosphorylase
MGAMRRPSGAPRQTKFVGQGKQRCGGRVGHPEGRLHVGSDEGLTPYAEWVLAHEYTHSITDQHFHLTYTDELEDASRSPCALVLAQPTFGPAPEVVGQTAELAPADRRLYAIRDATGTVESIHLIVASILSKKLAAGLDALVMDVKVGSGAFMPRLEDARDLAGAIVEVARGNRLPTSALITDMDRVLGRTAGNAVEVLESVSGLTDPASLDARLREVTLALCAELLVLGRVSPELPAARASAERALESSKAAARIAAMVAQLGGPSDFLEAPERHLRTAAVRVEVFPASPGIVERVDVRDVGLAVVALGGGRVRESDPVDHSVGLTDVAAPGERVGPGERPLAVVHAADSNAAERCADALRDAYVVGEAVKEGAPPSVLEILR